MENSFLVFSDDFGEHPSSCQHLIRYVPDNDPVLWVNTVGMRTPKFNARDFEKIFVKLKKMAHGLNSHTVKSPQTGRIHVCQPPMLPFIGIPGIKAINKASVCKIVNRRLKDFNMECPVVIITAPNACDFTGLFGDRRIVYYCVDDFSEWPGLDKQIIQQMDDELIRKADILIATSKKLFDKLSHRGKDVHLLTHGVDYEFFRNAPEEEHPLLSNIPKPRVGYFGLFDDRSNKDLIEGLAGKMTDISFVITGNVETDISGLKKYDNVYFTGSIPYNELPAMAKGWDVCMLPYKVNKLTDAIQPLKIKEYLATGKPVISTPIIEARKLEQYVVLAADAFGWEKKIRLLIEGRPLVIQKEVDLFVEKESWAIKAKQFFEICTAGL